MSTSAVTAMPNAHFTSSPITSPPSARTCRSAHVRPRSLPCISRSPRPSLMARVALQSASPDSSSQMTIESGLPRLPLRAPRETSHQQRAGARQPRAQAPQPRGAGVPQQKVAHRDDESDVLREGRGLGGPLLVRRRLHRQGCGGRQGPTRRSTPTGAPPPSTRPGPSGSVWPTAPFPAGRRCDIS